MRLRVASAAFVLAAGVAIAAQEPAPVWAKDDAFWYRTTVNGANVVSADIVSSNGVIHVIDAVILPPASAAQAE